MSEPFTLSAVSAVVLKEGIKFLYNQAAEALKRWREHREAASGVKNKTVSAIETPPPIFVGKMAPLEVHLETLEPLNDHLLKLREGLANYVDDLEPVDPTDQQLLQLIDALRQVMEAVFQQRFTFRGEQRADSGPIVVGMIDIENVAGKAAAVEAKLISGGRVLGTSKAKRVEMNGTIVGVKADKIGD